MKNTGLIEPKTCKALLFGAIMSISVTLFTCGVLALLIENRKLNESVIGYGVLGIILLSAITGGSISIGLNKTKRILTGLISGLLYGLCLLACTALFFNGRYKGVGVTFLVIVAGSLIPGLLKSNETKKHISSRRTRRNR